MVVGNQEKKVEESKKAIRLFHTFNSSIASFSPEPLLDVAQPCFVAKDKDALQCRTQLVGALLNGGFAKEAKAQLLMLDQDPSTAKAIPPSVLKGLGEKIAISEDAQKLLRF